MSDKSLKDMWNSADEFAGASGYEDTSIQKFISSQSSSIAEKIRKLLQMDIGIKLIVALMLLIDAFSFFNIQPVVSYVCFGLLFVLSFLLIFNFRILEDFSRLADYGQTTRKKLSNILIFLKSRFFTALLSISSTYFFGFIAGVLLYFYFTYGYLRRLDNMDIGVFSTICLIGIVMNYATYSNLVKYQIRHLKLCLSDLNENSMELVTQNIEEQQKKDRIIKVLITAVLILGLLVFIALLKKFGY